MKEIIKPAFRLFIIALIAAALLGGTYILTKEPIAQQELSASIAARREVLAEAADFEQVDLAEISANPEYESVKEIYRGVDASGETVGYTISILAKGYNPNINLTLGVDTDGVITALNVGSNEESPGLGANAAKPEFYGQFSGKTGGLSVTKGVPGDDEIAAISGATMTSRGVTNAVNTAMNCYQQYLAD